MDNLYNYKEIILPENIDLLEESKTDYEMNSDFNLNLNILKHSDKLNTSKNLIDNYSHPIIKDILITPITKLKYINKLEEKDTIEIDSMNYYFLVNNNISNASNIKNEITIELKLFYNDNLYFKNIKINTATQKYFLNLLLLKDINDKIKLENENNFLQIQKITIVSKLTFNTLMDIKSTIFKKELNLINPIYNFESILSITENNIIGEFLNKLGKHNISKLYNLDINSNFIIYNKIKITDFKSSIIFNYIPEAEEIKYGYNNYVLQENKILKYSDEHDKFIISDFENQKYKKLLEYLLNLKSNSILYYIANEKLYFIEIKKKEIS